MLKRLRQRKSDQTRVEAERRASDPSGASTRRPSRPASVRELARSRPSEPSFLSPTLTNTSGGSTGGFSLRRLTTRSPSPSSRSRRDGAFSGNDASAFGLHVLHQPEFPTLDIVFVHGLGGHRQRTWSQDHDPALFWPELWLPFEPGVERNARIMTFGYNANWRGGGSSVANISDFAKDLLFELRFAKDECGDDLDVGAHHPVIFVVHSMGGLVVKKAYLLGLHDDAYRHIIVAIEAIIFLSTPHRGSNYAENLSKVLTASFQSKSFVADLMRGSSAIEEINEQFRHLAPKLSIWSFYETLATPIGPKKIMVLEKESSVLGYPGEISKPLLADHHHVCKYSSPSDSNYISVRNAIKSLLGLFRTKASQNNDRVQELFRECITSEVEFEMLSKYRIPDTCRWFLSEPEVQSWLEPSGHSHILWYAAPPASGKSVLASFVIDHLLESRQSCQFFHFKYSDPSKRSVASALLAIALQLSRDQPDFHRLLAGSPTEMLGVDARDPSLIWRGIFERILFQSSVTSPIFWVIDGLDECDSPAHLLECLRSLPTAGICIKILLLSRNTDAISIAFNRLSRNLPTSTIEKTGQDYNQHDIALLVREEMQYIGGSDEFRSLLTQNILGRAQGNFLWTRLVLDEVAACHTEEGIQEALDEIPDDMMKLYERMEKSLLGSKRTANESLLRAVLEWSICSQRSLTLKELSFALQPEFRGFIDLKRTIQDACGQFVQVDMTGRVSILHHTAREYFTGTVDSRFYIDTKKAHARMFKKTISVLEEEGLRWRLLQGQHALQSTEPFLFYAALNWSYHLGHANSSASDHLDDLVRFFKSPAVLSWIHLLALQARLEVLVKASKILSSFIRARERRNTSINPMLHRVVDLDHLNRWVTDLVKIVGKFGLDLVTEPGVVYELIPALCPTNSVLHQQYHDAASSKIKLLGTTTTDWNDHLARLPLPGEARAWSISCAGKYVAVLSSTSTVYVWDSSNFSVVAMINHGEPVTAITLNGSGSTLATFGLKTTKLWSLPSGLETASTTNPQHTKAKQIVFAENGQKLLVGGDDNVVRTIRCDGFADGWQVLNTNLLKDNTRGVEGAVVNSPMCLAFNGDNTQIGVSYRGAPLSVWRLLDGRCVNKCKRSKDFLNDARRSASANWFAVDRFTWNPVTGHVLGIYRDGCVFKWHPLTNENVEAQQSAGDEISASSNGKLFATSSSDGSVRVWNFACFGIIYQLSSEDLVTGLAFSPDGRRFYDLRGSSVNAWEPASVARFLENEDVVSDSASEDQSSAIVSKISEEFIEHVEPVTALAVAPGGAFYSAGFADGAVLLYCQGHATLPASGMEITRFYNFLQVTHLKWSPDNSLLVAADLAGEISVMAIDQGGNALVMSHLPAPSIKLHDQNIVDVLFSPDGHKLLVSTDKQLFVCSVRNGNLLSSLELEDGATWKWLSNPEHTDVVLGFGPTEVKALTWASLTMAWSLQYMVPVRRSVSIQSLSGIDSAMKKASLDDESQLLVQVASITSVMMAQDGQHILVQGTRRLGAASATADAKLVLLVPISQLKAMAAPSGPDVPSHLVYLAMPLNFPETPRAVLGVMPGLGLTILDENLWLRIYPLDTGPLGGGGLDDAENVRRIYFIPKDWVGGSSLSCCALSGNGALFWPRDEKVVIVDCNLDELCLSPLYA